MVKPKKPALAPLRNCFSNLSTVFLWNSNIRDAVNQGHPHKALLLFRQMKQTPLNPNNLTFPFIAKACAKLSNLLYSQIFHTHVAKSPFQSDIYVQTALVDMYVKCGHLDYASKVFEKIIDRDLTSWNVMLMGYAQMGLVDKVAVLLYQMRFDGICPDSVTIMGLTQLGSGLVDLKLVSAIHCFGIRIGVEGNVSVANTWVSAYAKCGNLGMSEQVFGGVDLGLRTVVSWNCMLSGYAYFEESVGAVGLYKRMLSDGVWPDVSTILSLLCSCARADALCHGKSIHCHGVRLGFLLNISVINTLISMYSKCGDIDSARCVFDSVRDRTCVSWNAIIGGYTEKGDLDGAFTLFNSMEAAGEKPDVVTLLYMISCCGQTGSVEVGRWIDSYIISNRLKKDVILCNALIDMYAKCGSIRDARDLFDTMQGKTVVSWTSMISGCALNGEFKEALDLFYLMLELGLRPNHITFLAVLQACNHAGLLEKGWECFNLMTKVHRINPGLDHYSCLADLLGRKGKLEDALQFIEKMPVKPDAGIWGALLSACKNHRNVEIGEYASHRLFELEPEAATPYVEMANLYASVGRWDGVAGIRKLMKGNQVTKFAGQSLVQVNGKIHKFKVEDRSHSEGHLIYGTLDALTFLLKLEKDSAVVEEVIDNEYR